MRRENVIISCVPSVTPGVSMASTESQRNIYNQMTSEHVDKIRYLHSFGDGSRFGIIYITNDDEAYGVGYNGDFNLLGPSGENFLKKTLEKPVKIPGLCGRGIKKISIGDHKGIALGARGVLFHWGLPYSKIRSSYDKSSIQLPHAVTFLSHVVSALDCGGGFFGVISDSKKVFMWGYIDWSAPFSDGRLFSPMHKEVEAISCGAWHMSMLTTDGKIYTFGHGGYGQLGYDWSEDFGYWRVEKIPFSEPCIQTHTGSVTTMFVTESGELWACGLNHPQFGRLGVDSEEPTIKKPIRVKIDEPVSEVSCSYTLCNLHNVYAAKSKVSPIIYAWGWGFESKWPQPYENATMLYDVFHYIASPSNLDDRFVFSKVDQNSKIETKAQPETKFPLENNTSTTSFGHNSKNVNSIAPVRIQWNPPTAGTSDSKINMQRPNNLKTASELDKNDYCSENNKLLTKTPPFRVLNFKKPPSIVCKDSAYKCYLDYVYSGGCKPLEFEELIDVYLVALRYEETQLIEHTFNQIQSRVNESNFSVLLQQSQTHQSLRKLCQTFITTLYNEPQKLTDLLMSLKIKN